MAKNKYYLTTAIPYVNAKPHIGFALELVQTDVIARQKRQDGADVFFLTGTDDNSLKNVQAAEKAGLPTKDFVDQNASIFQKLTKDLNVSNDAFMRTASEDHFKGAQKLWSACDPDDIYKKRYKGLYCVGCEVFYNESELIDGRCPEHHTVPEEVEEENYFFKLSKYQDKLERLIADDVYHVVPDSRKKEILSFIRMGLQDFSISRSVARAKNWGVPVPGDPSQIMYVWFDALSNYMTALGYAENSAQFKKYWPADLHVIGKGIIRFHAVYWPAMLLSAGIPLPKKLFVHGYVSVGGEKMSKSLGNVVDPFELVEKYGVDAVRFYLLKHMHPFEDSDFTIVKFEEAYNADLANGLGNLIARVTNMIEKYMGGTLPHELRLIHEFQSKVRFFIEQLAFRGALQEVWLAIQDCDELIDKEKPWALFKNDTKRAENILEDLAVRLYNISVALRPFMPETAEKIEKALTVKPIVKYSGLFARIDS
ncbi:MAG: methionine--tRNA ligase [Candidatus Komeilibacteria bacterium]|nr:methionine--tRNA ligase [Candidatus Komeilibacteria bacterium]